MTVMFFLFQELLEEGDSPHDSKVFFVSSAVGGKGIPHDSHIFVLFQELLEEEDSPHDSNATLKAKTLYKSCMNMSESVCFQCMSVPSF